MADTPPTIAPSELRHAVFSLAPRLSKNASSIRLELLRCKELLEKNIPLSDFSFELATSFREVRVLGGLLNMDNNRRREILAIDGRLDNPQITVVLELVELLRSMPLLIDALAWTLPGWFPRQSATHAMDVAPTKVFVSYSKQDHEIALSLATQLRVLEQHEGLIKCRSVQDVRPGADFQQEIEKYLASADLVLVLVSAALLVDDQWLELLQKVPGSQLVPILIAPCLWQSTFLREFRVLPDGGRPLSTWRNVTAAWQSIIGGVRARVLALREDHGSPEAAGQSPGQPQLSLSSRFSSSSEQRTVFTYLHLSDLHISTTNSAIVADRRLMLNALKQDISEQLQNGLPPLDAIFVTGDIAFSGGGGPSTSGDLATEYAEAKDVLLELARTVGLGHDRVFLVPGNHDVQRSVDKERSIKRLLRVLLDGHENLDEALADPHDRALLEMRFANYLKFATGFAPAALNSPPVARLWWGHSLPTGSGLNVHLCGLNTAWASSGEDDFGHLQIGKGMLTSVLASSDWPGPEITIMLSHHPLIHGWFADEKDVLEILNANVHIILCGNDHRPQDKIATRNSPFIHLVVGSNQDNLDSSNISSGQTYSIGSLRYAAGKALSLRVWPRRWSNTKARFVADERNSTEPDFHIEHNFLLNEMSNDRGRRGSNRLFSGPANEYQPQSLPKPHVGQNSAIVPNDVRILFLAAVPNDLARIGIQDEVKEIHRRLERSAHKNRFTLISEPNIEVADLAFCILQHRPTVVHFSCHASTAGEILLKSAHADGSSHAVTPDALRMLFEAISKSAPVKCVVLNACFTADKPAQALALADVVGCVVAMSGTITDHAAINFSSGFYEALGFGKNIAEAFQLGVAQMALMRNPEHDMPRLICSPRVDPARVFLIK